MRRPRFKRWIKKKALAAASTDSFNLRLLAAQAQRSTTDDLPPALLLYAHENDCINKLLSYIYDDMLRAEYISVEQHLGTRSAERLALRGTPMRSLPKRYQKLLEDFERAYYAPEHVAKEKEGLQQEALRLVLHSGLSPSAIANALKLDVANVHAFLMRGETQRFTLETAREIAEFAQAHENMCLKTP